MAVSVISQSITTLGAFNNQAQGGDAQSNPLANLQSKDSAAQAQLSLFGRVQSSLDDLQSKAQALKNFSKPPTLSEFKVVVQGFVQSFNNLNRTVNEVASSKPDALRSDSRLGKTLDAMRNAAAGPGGASISTLQKQGVERQKEGGLSLNQSALERAFQNDRQGSLNTFAEVADRIGKAIDRQLSSNGSIGSKAQSLSASNDGGSAPPRLDVQKSFQQRLAAQLANTGGYVARNAVVSYFNVAAM